MFGFFKKGKTEVNIGPISKLILENENLKRLNSVMQTDLTAAKTKLNSNLMELDYARSDLAASRDELAELSKIVNESEQRRAIAEDEARSFEDALKETYADLQKKTADMEFVLGKLEEAYKELDLHEKLAKKAKTKPKAKAKPKKKKPLPGVFTSEKIKLQKGKK